MDFEQSFRHKTLSYSVDNIVRSIDRGQIIIDADFKDKKSWSRLDRSQFIESSLLSIPTQPIWCEESQFGQFYVIDGTERLRSLVSFVHGEFPLEGLTIKEECNYKNIHELPYHEIMNIRDGYALQFNIIDYDTHSRLKFEFYKRLNKNDKSFSTQAARNYAYRNSLNYLRHLCELTDPHLKFAYRPRFRSSNTTASTSKEETLLRLLHFVEILDHHLQANYLVSVDDELDRLTYEIESELTGDSTGKEHVKRLTSRLLNAVTAMRSYYSRPITVELTNNVHNNEDFVISEFYIYFIRALCGKFHPSPKNVAPHIWINSRRKAASLITDVRNIANA